MKRFVRVILISTVIVCTVFVCSAQDKIRRIEHPARFIYPNTPIEVAFRFDGKSLPNRMVEAGPDWLRKISLEITNVSGKDINAVRIDLMLREPKYGVTKPKPEELGVVLNVLLSYAEPTIKVLPAGDRVTIKLPVSMVDLWTNFLREQGVEDIEKISLDIRSVQFTDDTGWFIGYRTRKDPASGNHLFVTESPKPSLD